MTTPPLTPSKSLTVLALAATALLFGSASLLLAHEPRAKANADYQQIEGSDLTLVMSRFDQERKARHAVFHELIRPLRPTVALKVFSRSEPRFDPDFRPVFAQAQNGIVPFAIYKHTNVRKPKAEQTKTLHLVGFYDVTQGDVMVFDSNARTFVAAKGLGEKLQKIGSHQPPAGSTDRPTELAKHHPLPQEITQ